MLLMLSMIIVVIVTHLTGQLVQVAKRLSKALFQDWQSESSPHSFFTFSSAQLTFDKMAAAN